MAKTMKHTIFTFRFFKSWVPVILLFLAAFAFGSGCSTQKRIVHALDEKEANEIVVFLDRQGIIAHKVPTVEARGGGAQQDPTYDITVAAQDTTEAMALLGLHGLPRRKNPDLLSLFQKGGLVPSELEEKVKYQEGLAEKIAGTIRRIDGVLDAVVQLSFPEENPLNPEAAQKEKTASVYVKHQGVLEDPNSQLITKIKRLVASSIEGLKFDNVTVIPDRARFIGSAEIEVGEEHREEQEYVRIWGVVLSRGSVSHFQSIFFAFSAGIGVLILFILWMLIKFHLVLSRAGGMMQLLKLRPIQVEQLVAVPEEKSEEAEETEESEVVEEAAEEDEEEETPS